MYQVYVYNGVMVSKASASLLFTFRQREAFMLKTAPWNCVLQQVEPERVLLVC